MDTEGQSPEIRAQKLVREPAGRWDRAGGRTRWERKIGLDRRRGRPLVGARILVVSQLASGSRGRYQESNCYGQFLHVGFSLFCR
jgi:hypothetical protein